MRGVRGVPAGLWAGLSLSLVVLAGCSEAPADEEPFAGVAPVDVEVSSTLGAIAGLVVDEAIRPLVGANVTLLVDPARGAVTDDQGRFAFEGLAPGTYFVKVEAYRYDATQVSADVLAGEATTLRVLLVALTTAVPYHTVLHFEGHIDAWLGFGQFALELVSPGTVPCTCSWTFPVEANLTSIVFESDGVSSIPNPGTPATDDGDAYWELISEGGEGEIMSEYDDWPFVKRFEATDFEDPSGPFLARITGGVPPSGQMDYDLYITLWYHEPAPETWSFLAGNT